MKKENKFAVIISYGMICLGVFIIIWMLPFLYMYIGMIEYGKTNVQNLKWDRLAVKYSLFKSQKLQTIPSAVTAFSLAEDYDTVIDYSKKLEHLNALTSADKYFLSKAYMEKGDYENALKYASNKTQELQIYIKMKDIKKAQAIIKQLLAEKNVKHGIYLYKAEVEIEMNNWHDANISIDKLLEINPMHLEAMKVKAKILKHFGKLKEYKVYEQKIKNYELRTPKLKFIK